MLAYYDGTKILSMLDINGEKPEIYMVTTNRTGGKTTWFSRYLVKKFLDTQSKFMLIYRYGYELSDIADKFFKDIHTLFFPSHTMSARGFAKGSFYELYLDDNPCGYAISINNPDNVKKYSHLFSDVDRMFFDEFQSETSHYCSNEIQKLLSIHTSVARGQGKQSRYVPCYMCSNSVSILNPYYTALGVVERLRDNTKFLRGDGWVLEQGYIESAADALKNTGFNRAFKNEGYVAYASQNVYLNDNTAFVEEVGGRGQYMCTVKYMDRHYGIIQYAKEGIMYVTNRPDMSHPMKLSLTTADHNINYVMLSNNSFLISNFRNLFNRGAFRFKNLECKAMLLQLLSY